MAPLSALEHQQVRVESPSFWHRVRFGVVARHLRDRRATTVVDIGAGSGLLGPVVEGIGVAYRFTESSQVVRDRLVGIFGADALDTGGPVGNDTVVTLLDVIEHVDDDFGLVRGVAARMQPGAGLIVTAPAGMWLYSSWDADLGHVRRYSRRGLVEVIERSGFVVSESGHLFPELVLPAMWRKLRRRGGGPAEFPSLPRWVDTIAGVICATSARFRRHLPFGTSVIVIARRSGPSEER